MIFSNNQIKLLSSEWLKFRTQSRTIDCSLALSTIRPQHRPFSHQYFGFLYSSLNLFTIWPVNTLGICCSVVLHSSSISQAISRVILRWMSCSTCGLRKDYPTTDILHWKCRSETTFLPHLTPKPPIYNGKENITWIIIKVGHLGKSERIATVVGWTRIGSFRSRANESEGTSSSLYRNPCTYNIVASWMCDVWTRLLDIYGSLILSETSLPSSRTTVDCHFSVILYTLMLQHRKSWSRFIFYRRFGNRIMHVPHRIMAWKRFFWFVKKYFGYIWASKCSLQCIQSGIYKNI